MSDAPERIWASNTHIDGYFFTAKAVQPRFQDVEYRRADLPPTVSEALKLPEIAALVEALEQIVEHCQNNGIEMATVGERVVARCEDEAIFALAAPKKAKGDGE